MASENSDLREFRLKAVNILREYGIDVSLNDIVSDGRIHRVDTLGYAGEKSSGLISFLDQDPCVCYWSWHINQGEKHTFFQSSSDLSKRCTKTRETRLHEVKAQHEQERRKVEDAASVRAIEIWGAGTAATNKFPYLKRKNVPPCNLRVYNSSLIIPITDQDNKLWSLQFITSEKDAHGRDKTFLTGGRLRGCFFRIASKNSATTEPLLLCEGAATGLSLSVCTGFEVWCAMSGWNLKEVAAVARNKYQQREILVCADNDTFGRDGTVRAEPPGVMYAEKAAATTGVPFVVCPLVSGKNADFNDLHASRGCSAVNEVVLGSLRDYYNCRLPDGYYLVPDGIRSGLYYSELMKDGKHRELHLGPPLRVVAFSRNYDGNDWGLLLEWYDRDCKKHTWTLPIGDLKKRNSDWDEMLSQQGWFSAPGSYQYLLKFFSLVNPRMRVRCVQHTGWYDEVYALPDRMCGAGNDSIVVTGSGYSGLYTQSGTFEEWLELPYLAAGNSRLTLALCAAFAGPLLYLSGMDSGGISFEGSSSVGKTTYLRAAASVWGGPEHVRTWRATANGLEGTCSLFNDNLMILDELGQVSPADLDSAVYMVCNGMSKARASKNGSLRQQVAWRLMLLSSGEVGLAEKLSEIGRRSRAGQEVRFCGITVNQCVENLHGFDSTRELIDRICGISNVNYGHAGVRFINYVSSHFADVAGKIRRNIDEIGEKLCSADVSGQVHRVSRRFALIAAAGKLAQQAGVLPCDIIVLDSIRVCFDSWLACRGGINDSEVQAIISHVSRILEKDGASRFQNIHGVYAVCKDRLGFYEELPAGIQFYVLPEQFRSEICHGFTPQFAITALEQAGMLHRGKDNRPTTVKRLPSFGNAVRCYVLTPLQNN